MPLAPGSTVGRYELRSRLGGGAMGVVWLAVDPDLERRVALKLISAALGHDPDFRARFLREARAAAAVDHPHVLPVYEAGTADGELYLAMRYVPGVDLATRLARSGPLPLDATIRLVEQLAAALAAAHAAGVIHRDLKPANVLLGPDDHAYLADFGLARSAASPSLTRPGQMVGTAAYTAPELLSGAEASPVSDGYALACLTVEALTGSPPFTGPDELATLYAHAHAPPPALVERRPDLPPGVQGVIDRGLAKDPAARYPEPLAFAQALRGAVGPQPDIGHPPYPREEPDAVLLGPSAEMITSRSEDERVIDGTTALLLMALAGLVILLTAPLWDRFPGFPGLEFWALDVAPGVALIATGYLASRRPTGVRIGQLAYITAVAYFLPYLATGSSELAITLGAAAWYLWVAAGLHLVLSFPDGRLPSRAASVAVFAAYAITLFAGVVDVLMAPTANCAPCPSPPFPNEELWITIRSALDVPSLLVIGVALTALIRRWRDATPTGRRILNPLFATLTAVLLVNAAPYALSFFAVPSWAHTAGTIATASTLLVPAGVALGLWRGMKARSALTQLYRTVMDARTIAALEEAIQRGLADDSARIMLSLDERGPYLQPTGCFYRVAATEPLTSVAIVRTRRGVVSLAHDRFLSREAPELIEAISAAAGAAITRSTMLSEIERSLAGGQVFAAESPTRLLDVSVLLAIDGDGQSPDRKPSNRLHLLDKQRAWGTTVAKNSGTAVQVMDGTLLALFEVGPASTATAAVACAAELRSLARQDRGLSGELRIAIAVGRVTHQGASSHTGRYCPEPSLLQELHALVSLLTPHTTLVSGAAQPAIALAGWDLAPLTTASPADTRNAYVLGDRGSTG